MSDASSHVISGALQALAIRTLILGTACGGQTQPGAAVGLPTVQPVTAPPSLAAVAAATASPW
jgi:hypothetical protein